MDAGAFSAVIDLVHLLSTTGNVLREPKLAVQLYELYVGYVEQLDFKDVEGDIAVCLLAHPLWSGAKVTAGDLERAVEGDNYDWEREIISVMLNLATMVLHSMDDVEKDALRAVQVYQRAIEGGSIGALYHLARFREKDHEGLPCDINCAAELYMRVVEVRGDMRAMNELLRLLCMGFEGVQQVAERTAKVLERVGNGGNGNASVSLARLLQQDVNGVEKDAARAAGLHQQAIDASVVLARYELAHLLETDHDGLPRDTKRAAKLYDQVVEEVKDLRTFIELFLSTWTGLEAEEQIASRAILLFERVADSGNVKALVSLGHLLQ